MDASSSHPPSSTLLLLSLFSLLLLTSAAASTFDDSNPIRLSSDGLHELQTHFLQSLGHLRHVTSLARFAFRYEKKYDTLEEMRNRFDIFVENKKLIRSTNRS